MAAMSTDDQPSLDDCDVGSISISIAPSTRAFDANRFAGKTIIITGAGGQFGREGCIFFAKRGAGVAALDMDKEGLKGTYEAMKVAFGETAFDYKPYICDITNATQIDQVIGSVHKTFKRIDLLWNNAGYQGKIAPTLEYDPADFAEVMSVNVTGAFIIMQAVAKRMERQGGGGYSIVNTASVAGLRGTPAMIAYSSSKAAVLAMTVAASKDLAPSGIRVNAVSPALIGPGTMWERQNELHAKSGSPYFATTAEEVAQNKINSVPMKRLGSVEEVLNSVAFLLSDEASYTTGINLVIDGGLSAGLKA
jgi:NAD(P)-dependent dehydrogenase (short-subunit alcohol dehydrogenase family)